MSQSDLDVLLDMGFEKARADLAVKKSGGLQGALEWLEKNQDKSLEDVLAEEDEDAEAGPTIAGLESGQDAKSLVCNECGKKFRNQHLAQYHAAKTQHTDFSESTDEIAPLTEEQKAAKLDELRQKLADKKANQAIGDKDDAKRNEKIRQKSTRETQDLKDDLQRKQRVKEAEEKKLEKLADAEAKRRIKAKIEADREDRRRKAEEAKAAREGRAEVPSAVDSSPAPVAETKKLPANHTETRLRLQTPSTTIIKKLPIETTLYEVAQLVEEETGVPATKFSTTYPKRVFSRPVDWGLSLKEAGMVPSSVLIVN